MAAASLVAWVAMERAMVVGRLEEGVAREMDSRGLAAVVKAVVTVEEATAKQGAAMLGLPEERALAVVMGEAVAAMEAVVQAESRGAVAAGPGMVDDALHQASGCIRSLSGSPLRCSREG